jgi:hypothetical protein
MMAMATNMIAIFEKVWKKTLVEVPKVVTEARSVSKVGMSSSWMINPQHLQVYISNSLPSSAL